MEKFAVLVFLISTMVWSDVNTAPCLFDSYETLLATHPRRISRTSSDPESRDSPSNEEVFLPTTELPTGDSKINPPREFPSVVNEAIPTSEAIPTDDSPTVSEEANPTDDSPTVSKEANPTTELPTEVTKTNPTPTTTESSIKKAAKALAESFHEMSRRLNQTFTPSTSRNGRSGILRLPGSNDVSDYMGIRIPPPLDFGNIRDAIKKLPTLPPLIKPTPPMHAIGLPGVLTDGNLHDLAHGR